MRHHELIIISVALVLSLLTGCDRPESVCARTEGTAQARLDACELGCAKRDDDSCKTLRELEAKLEAEHPITSYKDSREELRRLMEDLVKKHDGGERAIARAMARQLTLPDAKDYFTQHFGAAKGAALARELESSPLKLYALPQALSNEHKKGRKVILTNVIESAEDDGATYPQHLAIKEYKGQPPLKLYTVRLVNQSEVAGWALRAFIHDGQQFRFVGPMTRAEDNPPDDERLKAMRELPMRHVRQLMSENQKTMDEIMSAPSP